MKRLWISIFGFCFLILGSAFSQIDAPPSSLSDQIIDLRGDWHFKVYRKYERMFQYFANGGCRVTWEDIGAAKVPEAADFASWEIVQGPSNDYSTGGLLQMNRGTNIGNKDDRTTLTDYDLFPKWSESWWCKEINLPKGFIKESSMTLILGIIDDIDVVYVNGIPVAASGFKTKDGKPAPAANVPELGGFIPDGDFQFEKSYWEVPREYKLDSSIFHEGPNQICIRIYNNNSFGGFYDRKMDLAATKKAARRIKGLPIEKLSESSIFESFIHEQQEAIAQKDLNRYASTISDNYHQNELDKAGLIAKMEKYSTTYDSIEIVDAEGGFYIKDGAPCYSADRQIIGIKNGTRTTLFDEKGYIVYFETKGDKIYEKGNWSRCYTVPYTSTLPKMNGKKLSYSVYLPPSYYESPNRYYPTVYLLHGINSTGRSFIDVDHINDRMDEWIKNGEIIEMIIIMPDSGKSSGYRDTDGGPNDSQGPWASHITVDILGQVESTFRVIRDPHFRGLSGISMGGGGVFRIGMTHTDIYTSFASHMGALQDAIDQIAAVTDEKLLEFDFYLDCGYQDGMVNYKDTEATAKYLESRHANVVWELRDGGHNSAFYMAGMLKSMKMHSSHFQRNGLQ